MARKQFTLDLTDTNEVTEYMPVETGQKVFIGFSSWGTGGTITAYITSIEADVDGVETPIITNGEFTEADSFAFDAPTTGKMRLKVTAAGSAGNAVGELTTNDIRNRYTS